jgi:Tol biopolymer transport system component
MKNRKFILFLTVALAACSTTAGPISTEPASSTQAAITLAPPPATQQSYSDPFTYCDSVGQIDTPDARYAGPRMSDELFKDYIVSAGLDASSNYPETFKQMTIWRCMNHQVYACNFGANIPCDSKANTDKTPTQAMIDYCQSNQGSDFIPMAVTGHEVIYSWHCVKYQPEILSQIDTVDAAGYPSSFWQKVEPLVPANPDLSSTPLPTGAPVGGGSGVIVFFSNRDGGYDNIYLMSLGKPDLVRLTQSQTNSFSGPFSPDGTRLLFTGFGPTHSYIGVMNVDGSDPIDLSNHPDSDEAFPAWSPDGSQVAFTSRRDGNNEIYIMKADGSDQKRLTNSPKDDFAPAYSPDGKQIAFVSDRDNATGIYSIYLMNADGSGVKSLTDSSGNDYTPAWPPDGSRIAFRSVQNGQSDIYLINKDGSGLINLTDNPAEDWSPAWSPDGSLIAFQTNQDGNWEIYTMKADGSDPVNLTNDPADDQLPYWRR